MGNAMEIAAERKLRFVVLDRPNPINGVDIAGPMLDENLNSFVAYHNLPLRHGMTVGEIAEMLRSEKKLELDLSVIRCEQWNRSSFLDATGMTWVNPSPNMRNLNQALLYPGIGLVEYTNLSVGRGTDTPFEHVGAPWLNASQVAAELNALDIPGVRCMPEVFTPSSSKYQEQQCRGVRFLITDRSQFEPVRFGISLAIVLRKAHPNEWEYKQLIKLLGSAKVLDAIEKQLPVMQVLELSREGLTEFALRRSSFLLY